MQENNTAARSRELVATSKVAGNSQSRQCNVNVVEARFADDDQRWRDDDLELAIAASAARRLPRRRRFFLLAGQGGRIVHARLDAGPGSAPDFMARLAALVRPSRVYLTRFHSLLASRSKLPAA